MNKEKEQSKKVNWNAKNEQIGLVNNNGNSSF